MLKLGLDRRWVDITMETITIASYSILINGEPKGFITPTRVKKQGDLLSPYLYLLCAEGLSTLLWKAEETRSLKGVLSNRQGYVFLIFCLLMIVCYFIKPQLRSAKEC